MIKLIVASEDSRGNHLIRETYRDDEPSQAELRQMRSKHAGEHTRIHGASPSVDIRVVEVRHDNDEEAFVS